MEKEDLIKAGHKIFKCHVYRPIKTVVPRLWDVKVVGKIDIENTQHDSHKYIIKYGDWYLCVKKNATHNGKMFNRYWCNDIERAKKIRFGSYSAIISKLKMKYNVSVETIKL